MPVSPEEYARIMQYLELGIRMSRTARMVGCDIKNGLQVETKVLALAGMYWVSLNNGFVWGQMTGMIRSLQKHEDGIELTEEQISFIASSVTMICLLGFCSAALVADKIGRRWSFILFATLLSISWIVLYCASEMYMFVVSRFIAGVGTGALVSLTICTPSEFSPPKTRGFYLNLITTTAPAMGTGFGHFLGIIMHWRNVALTGAVLSSTCAVIPFFWVESPHWLASRGMFAECERSFKNLHGITSKSEKELRMIIKLESCKLDKAKELNSKNTFKKLILAFKRKYFWDLMLLTSTLYAYLAAAGKLVYSSFATVMLEEMTGNNYVLLYTLLVDGFILIGSLLSCLLIRKMSMRNLLFSTGFIANAVLILLSASLYFKTDAVYFQWINVSLLALYFILVNAGPYPVSETLMSEVFPLDLKLYCFFFSCTTLITFFTLSVMLLPYIVAFIGYPGLFLLNVAIMSLSLGYIWIRLPETKGKTLQEIEVYFKTKDFNVDVVLNSGQMKSLI